ncbi:sporulation YhaL family protein [Halobacillus sp. K22]|uniref:sporulation YhaL family protein n=1 Tax=Halobacillus sp. K22 TaxID=3457431 RepID=UPI003FCE2A20
MWFGIPIWVFFCIVLIFVSGAMAFRSMRAEYHMEQQSIEQEGQIYLARMEEEKERRNRHRKVML